MTPIARPIDLLARCVTVIGAAVLVSACSDDPTAPPPDPPPVKGPVTCEAGEIPTSDAAACRPAGWATCPAGFAAEGAGCRALTPSAACAEGTRAKVGVASCEPIAALGCPSGFTSDGLGCREVVPSARCGGATRDAIGSTTCAPMGTCATPVAGATYFVDAAFTDGQLDATHTRTIAAAVAAAPAGAVVEVAAGTYRESIDIRRAITIAGRCAGSVILDGEDQPGRIAVTVSGLAASNVTIARLSVRRYEGAIRVGGKSKVTLSDVLFEDNHGAAATVADVGTELVVERCVVRGTKSAGSTNALGAGNGASLVVRSSSLVGNADRGITAKGGSLRVESTLVADMLPAADGAFGSGIVVLAGTVADITSTAVVGARSEGIYSEGTLTLSRSVVRATASASDGTLGRGVNLWRGKSTLTELTLDGNADVGLALERAATATVDGLVARDTGSASAETLGAGILVVGGGSATVKRAVVLRSKESGVQATGAQSKLVLEDAVVAGGRGRTDKTAGDGVVATDGGIVEVTGGAITDNAESALSASGAGAQVVVTSTVVADTRSNGKGGGGFGGRAVDGGKLVLSRSVVTRNRDIGLLGTGSGVSLELTDVEVSKTVAAASGASRGRGLEVNKGARATVNRAAFVDDAQTALLASSEGSLLDLRDVWVFRTRASSRGEGGRALTVQGGAAAKVASSAFIDQEEIGVAAVAGGASLEMTDSVVDTTRSVGGAFGHGVVGASASVALERCRIATSEAAGLAFVDVRASIGAAVVTKNGIGIFVDATNDLAEVPSASLPEEPGKVVVDSLTRFVDNATRVSAGTVPVPRVFE
ncbi:MAG: hypothetical protein JST00_00545 [Deltaproteobacteria bacterium]|nr:hypothetical protein [Deltaproteobacteria bacterium]